MNQWLRYTISIILCLVIIVSSLLIIAGLFMRQTLFADKFYRQIIASPLYLPMVKEAILTDLAVQSAYVDIPVTYLEAGLDDATLYMMARSHIDNTVDFLNFKADYVKPVYSARLFYEQLVVFINKNAADNHQTVTREQLEQLQDVATDSAAIVQQKICLINLEPVRQFDLFQRMHHLLYLLSVRLIWAAVLLLPALAALFALNWPSWRTGLNLSLISIWLTGSLMLVPSLVLQFYRLPSRLAIETAYLKFAFDQLLTKANQFFLLWGSCFFLITSGAMIALFLTKPHKKHHHQVIHTDRRGIR